jgi:VanZ family protein
MSSKSRGVLLSTPKTSVPRAAHPRDFLFWIRAWWPVAVGIYIISIESTPYFGSDRTSHPLRFLVQIIFGPLSDATWEILHHLIRKTGHFVGYGALGLAWLRAWRMTLPGAHFLSQAGLALLGTALVASCDEYHQTYLPNRTGTPWDVLLDCCGAGVLIGTTWLYVRFFRRARPAS